MEASCFWWSITFLLVIQLFASALEMDLFEYDSQRINCSKGLSGCTLKDVNPLKEECPSTDLGVKVESGLKVKSVLCCSGGTGCQPCLHVHFDLQPRDPQTESYVLVCHQVQQILLPLCRKLEFTVTPAGREGEANSSQWLSMLLKDDLVDFSSQVTVNVCSQQCSVGLPSEEEVCSNKELRSIVKGCQVPRVNIRLDQREMIQVENEKDSPFPIEMCLQHEENGVCMTWKERTIQLPSVTPCLCFQVWWDEGDQDRSHRVKICPFTNHSEGFQNVLDNVSVSAVRGQMNSGGTMLSWNLTAPCRLEGVAQLCQREAGLDKDRCTKLEGRQNPTQNETWRENDKGWLYPGVFENIDAGLDLCVMVTVKNKDIGPICPTDSSWWHWRWSLLVLVSVMFFGLAAICLYFLHCKLKDLAWRWHQRRYNQFARCHVVLLSPPDADDAVSELVCQLGSTLASRGHAVSVDAGSREELGSLGPLPWLHSKLQPPGGGRARAVLVLTRSACRQAEAWAPRPAQQGGDTERGLTGGEGEDRVLLPDLFGAALSCVEADRQQGRAGERFLLVQFQAHPAGPHGSKRGLPEMFRGLPTFHLPSQSRALCSELAMGPR